MANQQAAVLARFLSNVGKYSVLAGIGGSILQTSLFTGARVASNGVLVLICTCMECCWWCGLYAVRHADLAVDGGERAVMYDRLQVCLMHFACHLMLLQGLSRHTIPCQGVVDKPVEEGTHFRIPWLQTPNIMDIRCVCCTLHACSTYTVRIRPRNISSVTGTKGACLVTHA